MPPKPSKKWMGSHLPRKGTICWLDSTVALHWLRDQREYRQFVTNHVQKIQSHPNTQWRHVPSTENLADLGSRCASVTCTAVVERPRVVSRPNKLARRYHDASEPTKWCKKESLTKDLHGSNQNQWWPWSCPREGDNGMGRVQGQMCLDRCLTCHR